MLPADLRAFSHPSAVVGCSVQIRGIFSTWKFLFSLGARWRQKSKVIVPGSAAMRLTFKSVKYRPI